MHGIAPARVNRDVRAFLEALETLGQQLAFADCTGRITVATSPLARLMKECPALAGQLASFSVDVCEAAHQRVGARAIRERVTVRELTEQTSVWRATASYVSADLFGFGPTVLIALEEIDADPLAPHVLRERFGLSKQECKVARLIAQGRANAQIAEILCISPHTTRHHTRRIVTKVGAASRAALISKLVGVGE